MIKLFSGSDVDQFAKDLAKDIGERYPAAIANDPGRKVSANRLTAILEEAFSRASEFAAQNKLGYFKKAKLGNTFRWEYTVAATRNPLTHLRYKLWMYLLADGETLINRVTITKLGVILARTTEHFHRGTGPVPPIARR